MTDTRTRQILEFFKLNGIELHENLQLKVRTQDSSFYVQAVKAFTEGDIAATIPKDAILSIRNTAIADIIQDEELGGLLALNLAIMYELQMKEKSPWFLYLDSINEYEPNVPLFWSADELTLLEGTDLGRSLETDRGFLAHDYFNYIQPLFEKYPKELDPAFMTLERWFQTASIVTSRAFQVDDYHGEAIVPFADMFNHKTDREHVHFEGIGQVCPFCGVSGDCDCELSEDEWSDVDEEEQQQDETMENAAQEEEEDDEIPDAVPIEQEENQEDNQEELDNDILDMVFIRPCAANQEIFNTYGQHGTCSLIRLYGFVEDEFQEKVNPYSYVRMSKEELVFEVQQLKLVDFDMELLEERVAFWDQVGRDIVEQIEDMASGQEDQEGCQDGCCGQDEEHDGHEHGHHHSEESESDQGLEEEEEEEEDMQEQDEEEEEEDQETQDDFCIQPDQTPSFSLYAFAHLLLMSPQLFEVVATDLERVIDMLVAIKNELLKKDTLNQSVQQGKGKKQAAVEFQVHENVSTELTEKVLRLLKSACRTRLDSYPEWHVHPSTNAYRAKMAQMLRQEEMLILNNFIKEF